MGSYNVHVIGVQRRCLVFGTQVRSRRAKLRSVASLSPLTGRTAFMARACLQSFARHVAGERHIVFIINVSDDPVIEEVESACGRYDDITVIRRTSDAGGLTATWNMGILECKKQQCDVVVLSNHDLFIDKSFQHLIAEASNCPESVLEYFSPTTNNPGVAACNLLQKATSPREEVPFVNLYNGKYTNLNGFVMAFPFHILEMNRFGPGVYFDPAFPFGGNETEWFKRFRDKGGAPIVVPRTFVYHYKKAAWRPQLRAESTTCIYTVNTGGYEKAPTWRGDRYAEECKALYYSDNTDTLHRAASMGWTPIYVDDTLGLLPTERKLMQRLIKTCTYRYLPSQYSTSIYLDGNVVPTWVSVSSLFIIGRLG